MLDVVDEPLDGRFDHTVVPPAWTLQGQPVHGVHRSPLRPVPITTTQASLLVEGWQAPRDGELPQLILHGGHSSRPQLAIPLRDVPPSDELGPVALPLESRHERVQGRIAMALIVLRPDAVHPLGGLLADVPPTRFEKRLVAPLIEVAEPMCGRLLGLLR
jgi:hypothetical protein